MPKSGRDYMERKLAERRRLYSGESDIEPAAAWLELGSDCMMDHAVLVRVRQEALIAENRRARRIARRGE